LCNRPDPFVDIRQRHEIHRHCASIIRLTVTEDSITFPTLALRA
jgi:hypothetical protein